MALRRLIIERSTSNPEQIPATLCVEVHDDLTIGPLVCTVAARFGYPLVDSFGTPIHYRLRSTAGGTLLPSTGRFAQVRFPSGSRFVLEAERSTAATMPLPQQTGLSMAPHREPIASARLSRRALLTLAGPLMLSGVLGLGAGMTTHLALHALPRPVLRLPAPTVSPQAVSSPRLVAQRTFTGHQHIVRALAWSPDGTTLASGGEDALVLLWRPDGTILQTLPCSQPVDALAWSPDGSQLALAAGQAVAFYDARTALLLAVNTRQHRAPVSALGWTQTTPALAVSAGEDRQAVVWNGRTHQPQVIFGQHTAPLLSLATLFISVATASQGGVIRVWSALNGQTEHGYFSETNQPIRAVAFSSTGQLAAGGDDGLVRLWQDGRACQRQAPSAFGIRCLDAPFHLRAHTGPVRAAAFSPDGALLATGGADDLLVLWQVASQTPLLIHAMPEVPIALVWSPDGSQLATTSGPDVQLWQLHRS